jgi:hypothetical protein
MANLLWLNKPIHPTLGVILIILGIIVVVAFVFIILSSLTFTKAFYCYDKPITVEKTVYGKENTIGIMATDGKGYITKVFSVVNEGYTYNMYCVYNNTGERVITNMSPNPYQCVKENGICK